MRVDFSYIIIDYNTIKKSQILNLTQNAKTIIFR